MADRSTPDPGRAALFAALLAATLTGCPDESDRLCRQPGLGEGPCCALALPDGARLEGVCLDARCRRADQPGFDGPCDPDAQTPDADPLDGAPPDADAAGSDAMRDAMRDAMSDTMPDGTTDGTTDATPDAGPAPCDGVVCEPGERCVPDTGECRRRPARPGGPCAVDADCAAGRCLSEAQTEGAVPGGFCSVPCAADADCGAGACAPVEGGSVCFEPCDGTGRCRAGWTCVDDGARAWCRVDCRLVGCPGQGRCEAETGACRPPPAPCRHPCALGESCEQSRCVRLDGTCATTYHCPIGETCHAGRCVPAEASPCAGDFECADSQRCVPISEGEGVCLLRCATDDDCPIDRACRPDLAACAHTVCGPGTGNGALLGPCAFGTRGDREGTCLPFDTPGEAPGFCVEAGLAAPGEPCDAQVEGRAPADRAIRCRPGALCHGDPDDPLHPERDWDARGTCAALCAPADPACPGDTACVDFGGGERALGLCLPVECRVLDPGACGPGARCRPFGLDDDAGACGPAGQADVGRPCASIDDCADVALCVSRGAGTECLAICDPAEPGACGDRRCYVDDGWGYGVCL